MLRQPHLNSGGRIPCLETSCRCPDRACLRRRVARGRADVGNRRRGAARPDRKPDADAHRPGRAIAVPQSAARAAIAPYAGRQRIPLPAAERQSGRRRAARRRSVPRNRKCRQGRSRAFSRRRRRLIRPPPQGARSPTSITGRIRSSRSPAGSEAMCSTRTTIRMRRARRVRSVRFRPASRPRRRSPRS